MRKAVAAIAACSLSLTLAAASDGARAADVSEGAMFAIMGPSNCARWPARGSIESAAKAVPLNWMLGFLSGEAERSDKRLFDLIDEQKVAAWLDTFCPANPNVSLPTAARVLTGELEA